MSQRVVDEATLVKLTELAGYDLPDERKEMVMGLYNALLVGFDAYESFGIKEMPPAHTFNPNWGE